MHEVIEKLPYEHETYENDTYHDLRQTRLEVWKKMERNNWSKNKATIEQDEDHRSYDISNDARMWTGRTMRTVLRCMEDSCLKRHMHKAKPNPY